MQELVAVRVPDEAFPQLPGSPRGVEEGTYRISSPLVHASRLTSKGKGGVGKQLSDGWACNFAVGCTHACPFCYVDEIHKRFGRSRCGTLIMRRWGDYLLVPENLDQAIEETPWRKWAGREVMMSSTHDPYLPRLASAARRILERALPAGVHFCIQTRSFLVRKDFDLLARYTGQIRLQVSIATANRELAHMIEPRVPPPEARIRILRESKERGLRTGVILAPIFPPTHARPDVREDLREMAELLREVNPDCIFGESLHARGQNLSLVREALGEPLCLSPGFDRSVSMMFREELRRVGLKGTWWPA